MAYREASLQNANRPSMQLKRRNTSSCRERAWPRPAVRSKELLDHDTSTVFHTNLLSTTHTGGVGLKAPKVFFLFFSFLHHFKWFRNSLRVRCLLQFVHLFCYESSYHATIYQLGYVMPQTWDYSSTPSYSKHNRGKESEREGLWVFLRFEAKLNLLLFLADSFGF